MVRKCGGRARGGEDRAEMVAGEAKRRKLGDGGGSVGISSTYMQLRSRRILLRNSVSQRTVNIGCGSENPSSAVHDDGGVSSSSRCSGDVHGYVDLEVQDRGCETETTTYGEVREEESESMENSSSTIESAERAKMSYPECSCSCRRTSSPEEKEMSPTEAELEEFFSAAEKQHLETYAEKYNFDFLEEKPREGSYEWVKLSE